MIKEKATHELRHHNFKKGLHHRQVLCIGSLEDCDKAIQKVADEFNTPDRMQRNLNVGIGYLLSNGGYSIVALERERIEHIQSYAPKLLNAAIMARNFLMSINTGDTGDQATQALTEALNECIPLPEYYYEWGDELPGYVSTFTFINKRFIHTGILYKPTALNHLQYLKP